MTLRLTVDAEAWRGHVERTARGAARAGPRRQGQRLRLRAARPLAAIAAELSSTIAVGTVHELDHVPAGMTAVVLTPTRRPPVEPTPILTVGSLDHVAALAGWRGRVIVKLASSMRRFGATPDELGRLAMAVRAAGLEIVGFAVHPPVAGTDDEHVDDIAVVARPARPRRRGLGQPPLARRLPRPARRVAGPTLPHPRRHRAVARRRREKAAMLHLGADVLDVRNVIAGDQAGIAWAGCRVTARSS